MSFDLRLELASPSVSTMEETYEEHASMGLDLQLDIDYLSIRDDSLKNQVIRQILSLAIYYNQVKLIRYFGLYSAFSRAEGEIKRAIETDVCRLVIQDAVEEAFQRLVTCSEGLGGETRPANHEALERHLVEGPSEDRKLPDPEADDELGHEKKVIDEKGKQAFETEGEDQRTEKGEKVDGESETGDGEGDQGGEDDYRYPLRPDAEDCSYYMRKGSCRFGSKCKFNHPLIRRYQPPEETSEEEAGRLGKIECKFYLKPGGCKYGKACKYNHSNGRPLLIEYNFMGLPIRLGHRECPYYMRTGSCKYGTKCRYNHPNPDEDEDEDAKPPPPLAIPPRQMLVSDFPQRPGQVECSYFIKTGDCKYRNACRFHHPLPLLY